MAQNEDIDYAVSAHATPEKKQVDPDMPNRTVLHEVSEYLADWIEAHNTFDVIDLTAKATLSATQQIAVNKQVVGHLRSIKMEIDSKLKELI